jgi:hypothetical protein
MIPDKIENDTGEGESDGFVYVYCKFRAGIIPIDPSDRVNITFTNSKEKQEVRHLLHHYIVFFFAPSIYFLVPSA